MNEVLTIDGRSVGLHDAGSGPGAPLLVLHGYTGSKEDFTPVVDTLAADRRVVVVDLPGHGDSPGPDDPAAYGLGALTAWVLRVADALDLGELHLLGHSMGGLLAQRIASLASQRLRSLILADTGLGALRDDVADLAAALAVIARDHGMQAAWDATQHHAMEEQRPHREIDEARERFVQRRFLAMNPAALIGGARVLIGSAPHGAFLRGIDLPVLVLHGDNDDRWLPSEQRLLARTIAGAEYVVIPDAMHSPQLENTDVWVKVVRDFLARAELDPVTGR